jgi:hypothetical protein
VACELHIWLVKKFLIDGRGAVSHKGASLSLVFDSKQGPIPRPLVALLADAD